MKLRILDDSIRLRLTQAEVQQIEQGEGVSARLRFSSFKSLTYELRPTSSDSCSAGFDGSTLSVLIPSSQLAQWSGTDQISIKAEQKINDTDTVRILIEKDFRCMHPREGEEESDRFTHPDHANC